MTPAAYRFGPFVVDRAAYRVLQDGRPLDLTPKLLDLLLHLIENAGSLVTKEALLDALWPGANVTDNALAQAVSELRQALSPPGSPGSMLRPRSTVASPLPATCVCPGWSMPQSLTARSAMRP